MAHPLDENADEYIYLCIPKSQMDNPDIKKILPDSEKDEPKPKQTKDSENTVKTEKSDDVKETEKEVKNYNTSPSPLTPPPQ